MVDKLIRKTAKELAGAFFDNQDIALPGAHPYQRSERFRQEAGNHDWFVKTQWAHFVPHARIILAHMLNEAGRPQREKDEIFDALLRDRGFKTDLDMLRTENLQ